jgi:hypothetical protein
MRMVLCCLMRGWGDDRCGGDETLFGRRKGNCRLWGRRVIEGRFRALCAGALDVEGGVTDFWARNMEVVKRSNTYSICSTLVDV